MDPGVVDVHGARSAEAGSTLLDKVPPELAHMLAWWTEETRRYPTFVRMILRESLDYAGGDPVESAARTAYYERQLEMLEALEERGEIDGTFDLEMQRG